jgi:hypothetical protein
MSTDSCSGHTVKEKVEYFNNFSRVLAPIRATYQPHAPKHDIAYDVKAEECDDELMIFDECVCVEEETNTCVPITAGDSAICTSPEKMFENEGGDQDLTLTQQRGVADYFNWIRKVN